MNKTQQESSWLATMRKAFKVNQIPTAPTETPEIFRNAIKKFKYGEDLITLFEQCIYDYCEFEIDVPADSVHYAAGDTIDITILPPAILARDATITPVACCLHTRGIIPIAEDSVGSGDLYALNICDPLDTWLYALYDDLFRLATVPSDIKEVMCPVIDLAIQPTAISELDTSCE